MSFEIIYQKYKLDIYYYLLSLTKDPALAQDLLSETFLHAFISLHQLKKEQKLKPWLMQIARNQFLSHCRKQKVAVEYDDDIGIVSDTAVDAATLSLIKELVQTKDERTQQLFTMRMEGYSYAEISSKLQLCESSCRVLEYRLRKWLKAELEKEDVQ